jgi:hypothetical protein
MCSRHYEIWEQFDFLTAGFVYSGWELHKSEDLYGDLQ